MEKPLLLIKLLTSEPLYLSSDRYEATRTDMYQASLLGNRQFQANGLVPRRDVLVGVVGCSYHSLNHRTQSLRYKSVKVTSSAAWWDVVKIAVLSASRDNSAWWEGIGMSLMYRLNRTGEIIPPWETPVPMSDHWMWLLGRTLRTSDHIGRKIYV